MTSSPDKRRASFSRLKPNFSPRSKSKGSSLSIFTGNTSNNSYDSNISPTSPSYNYYNRRDSDSSRHSTNSFTSNSSTNSSTNSANLKPISKYPKSHKPNHHFSMVDKHCVFCDEKFSINISTAATCIINLNCGHGTHDDCYISELNPHNLDQLPICSKCHKPAKPASIQDWQKMVDQAFSFYSAITPSTITSPLDFPLVFSATSSPLNLQVPENQNYPEENDNDNYDKISLNQFGLLASDELLNNLTKPKITMVPENSTISISDSTKQSNIPCVLNVQMPELPHLQSSPEDKIVELQNRLEISNWIINNVLHDYKRFKNFQIPPIDDQLLNDNILNINGLFRISEPQGLLIMFDNFEVEIDDKWDTYTLFLFSSKLLIADSLGKTIDGNVCYLTDLSTITKIDDFTLNIDLTTMNLPSLKLKNQDKIIILKWQCFFQKIINKIDHQDWIATEVPLVQMTSNCWDLIDSKIIPGDIKHLLDLKNSNIELPISLLTKLLPNPETPPLRLIICISLINKNPDKISNEDYFIKIKNLIKSTLDNLNPIKDLLGLVYIHKVPSLNNENVTKANYITGPNSWEIMEKNFEILKVENDSIINPITNLEEYGLYLEASSRIFEFWDDGLNINFIKEIVMITDSFQPELILSPMSSPKLNDLEFKSPIFEDSYHEKNFKNKVNFYLKKLVRKFKISIHGFLIHKKIDPHTIFFLQSIIKENYKTFGSTFTRINCFEDLSIIDLISRWKKIIIPSIKINLKESKKNIQLMMNEWENNQLNLQETLEVKKLFNSNIVNNNSSNSVIGLGINDSNNTLNLRSRRLTKIIGSPNAEIFPSNASIISTNSTETVSSRSSSLRDSTLLTSLALPLTPNLSRHEVPTKNYLNDISPRILINENEEEEEDDNLEIYINDIYPGFNKNLIIEANVEFDTRLKQMIKHSTKLAPNSSFDLPLLEYSYLEKTQKVDISVILNSHDSIIEQFPFNLSRANTRTSVNDLIQRRMKSENNSRVSMVSTFTDSSLDDDIFILPVFPKVLSSTRDYLFAQRQIQLTVISTLIYGIKLMINGNNEEAKQLILNLISNIFALGKNCQPRIINNCYLGKTLSDVRKSLSRLSLISNNDLIIESYEDDNINKYVEYLSFILGMLANLFVDNPEEAQISSYELICDLSFQ